MFDWLKKEIKGYTSKVKNKAGEIISKFKGPSLKKLAAIGLIGLSALGFNPQHTEAAEEEAPTINYEEMSNQYNEELATARENGDYEAEQRAQEKLDEIDRMEYRDLYNGEYGAGGVGYGESIGIPQYDEPFENNDDSYYEQIPEPEPIPDSVSIQEEINYVNEPEKFPSPTEEQTYTEPDPPTQEEPTNVEPEEMTKADVKAWNEQFDQDYETYKRIINR